MTPKRTVKKPVKTGKLDPEKIKTAVRSAYRYNTCHILYDPESKKWIVKNVRQKIGEKQFPSKGQAEGYAKKLSQRLGCDIIAHYKSGKIQKSIRHGII